MRGEFLCVFRVVRGMLSSMSMSSFPSFGVKSILVNPFRAACRKQWVMIDSQTMFRGLLRGRGRQACLQLLSLSCQLGWCIWFWLVCDIGTPHPELTLGPWVGFLKICCRTCLAVPFPKFLESFFCRYMAEILPIRGKTLQNQSIMELLKVQNLEDVAYSYFSISSSSFT